MDHCSFHLFGRNMKAATARNLYSRLIKILMGNTKVWLIYDFPLVSLAQFLEGFQDFSFLQLKDLYMVPQLFHVRIFFIPFSVSLHIFNCLHKAAHFVISNELATDLEVHSMSECVICIMINNATIGIKIPIILFLVLYHAQLQLLMASGTRLLNDSQFYLISLFKFFTWFLFWNIECIPSCLFSGSWSCFFLKVFGILYIWFIEAIFFFCFVNNMYCWYEESW